MSRVKFQRKIRELMGKNRAHRHKLPNYSHLIVERGAEDTQNTASLQMALKRLVEH